MVEVLEYLDQNGYSPFADWFNGLDAQAAAKVSTAQTKLGLGNWSKVKGVGGGVYERVIDFGPGYRIYFGKDGDKVVILACGRSQKTAGHRHYQRKRTVAGLQAAQEIGEMKHGAHKKFHRNHKSPS